MEIVVSQEKGRTPVTVLHLNGRLDASTHEQLRAQAEQVIKGGARHVLLDFSKVDYMSSAGIRVINHIFDQLRPHTAASNQAIEQGVRDGTYKSPNLKLLSPNPRVLESLKMVGMDMFLEIHSDLKSAIASFS